MSRSFFKPRTAPEKPGDSRTKTINGIAFSCPFRTLRLLVCSAFSSRAALRSDKAPDLRATPDLHRPETGPLHYTRANGEMPRGLRSVRCTPHLCATSTLRELHSCFTAMGSKPEKPAKKEYFGRAPRRDPRDLV